MISRPGFVKQNKEVGKVAGGETFKHIIGFFRIGNRGDMAHWAIKALTTILDSPGETICNVMAAIGAGLHQVTLTPAKAHHRIIQILYTHSSIIPQIRLF